VGYARTLRGERFQLQGSPEEDAHRGALVQSLELVKKIILGGATVPPIWYNRLCNGLRREPLMIKCEACLNEVDEVVDYAGQDVCQPCYSDVADHCLDAPDYYDDDLGWEDGPGSMF
jgi:hypothetical protein